MRTLSIAYFGTPDFSAHFLEKLLADKTLPIEVKLVVTQPDKPVGKKKIVTPSPVKEMARKYNIEVLDSLESVEKQIDLAIVYAYGNIIPAELLQWPRLGFINLHPSLLPKYRGASPMAYPLMMGDTKTGVSLMQMDEKMDHGPIITQQTFPIGKDDMRTDLEEKLTKEGYTMFQNFILNQVVKDKIIKPIDQDHSQATFTKLLNKDDGYISFSILNKALKNEELYMQEYPTILRDYTKKYSIVLKNSSSSIVYNLYRGLSPWPGVWTKVFIGNQEKRLKLIEMAHEKGQLVLKKVQLEGKTAVDIRTFNKAYLLFQ